MSINKLALSTAAKYTLLGAGSGALGGGGLGWLEATFNKKFKRLPAERRKKLRRNYAAATAVTWGTAGALLGHGLGQREEWNKFFGSQRGRRSYGVPPGSRDPFHRGFSGRPDWVGPEVRTKAQAKKVYYNKAMKMHPDRGGDAGKMQQINAEWEGFKNSHHWDKLAFSAFSSELQSIYAKR
jgi:hypothetical protein